MRNFKGVVCEKFPTRCVENRKRPNEIGFFRHLAHGTVIADAVAEGVTPGCQVDNERWTE